MTGNYELVQPFPDGSERVRGTCRNFTAAQAREAARGRRDSFPHLYTRWITPSALGERLRYS